MDDFDTIEKLSKRWTTFLRFVRFLVRAGTTHRDERWERELAKLVRRVEREQMRLGKRLRREFGYEANARTFAPETARSARNLIAFAEGDPKSREAFFTSVLTYEADRTILAEAAKVQNSAARYVFLGLAWGLERLTSIPALLPEVAEAVEDPDDVGLFELLHLAIAGNDWYGKLPSGLRRAAFLALLAFCHSEIRSRRPVDTWLERRLYREYGDDPQRLARELPAAVAELVGEASLFELPDLVREVARNELKRISDETRQGVASLDKGTSQHERVAQDCRAEGDLAVEPFRFEEEVIARLHAQQLLARVRPLLTRRQREVFEFMGAGLDDAEIAARLDIKEATVRVHRHDIAARVRALADGSV